MCRCMTQYCPQQLSNQIAEESQYLSLYCGGAPATAAAAPTTTSGLTGGVTGTRTSAVVTATATGSAKGTAKSNEGLRTTPDWFVWESVSLSWLLGAGL